MTYPRHFIFWLVLLAGAPILAWTHWLDAYSITQIKDSLASAGIFYATARGINGIVSVIQATELNLPFLTLGVGEILDPINDLIERFSGIILFAIGSLALQQILQLIVVHNGFNALLTAISLLTLATLLTRRTAYFQVLLRLFILTVFIRFAFALVIIANHWVDATFLKAQDEARHQAMQSFESELKDIQQLSQKSADFSREISALGQQSAGLEEDIAALERRLAATAGDIGRAETRLDARMAGESLVCRGSLGLSGCSDAVKAIRAELAALRDSADRLQAGLATKREQRDIAGRQAECLQKRERGERCSLLDLVPEMPDVEQLRNQLEALESKVTDFAGNIILLLTSVILKSVLIPLLFLYTLVQVARRLWRKAIDTPLS
ncbi:hypothetical protein FVW59_17660 [Parahaliea aestuarii]|uniref:Uncharacterized protein n=1 Tax=Parahaliea aestuarii TaxID=1852021 RepID=A0A5C8ZMD3_9GAMM|nr:hypothetical protein FVW59_17660 [Parahaliea aestuarii]